MRYSSVKKKYIYIYISGAEALR